VSVDSRRAAGVAGTARSHVSEGEAQQGETTVGFGPLSQHAMSPAMQAASQPAHAGKAPANARRIASKRRVWLGRG
jgi:hypothetical protein